MIQPIPSGIVGTTLSTAAVNATLWSGVLLSNNSSSLYLLEERGRIVVATDMVSYGICHAVRPLQWDTINAGC
jgi:hypothetical protein